MAMAQGHVHEAETYYLSAIRTIKAHQPNEPVYEVLGDMLLRELQFERNWLSLAMAAEMRLREKLHPPRYPRLPYTLPRAPLSRK